MHGESAVLLTIAWAIGLGLLAQILAHRFRLPAIVLLLAFGVAAGPYGLDLVHPSQFEEGLGILVKLAVAIILFEGALNLRLGDLRQAAREVRSLVTLGVLVSWVGGTLAALLIAGFPFPLALLFGALVTVTGPTVVQPLLKRMRVPRRLKTTLEGEAILIDPIGAILAVAVLDVVISVYGAEALTLWGAFWAYAGRLLVGGVVGYAGGAILSRLFKVRRLVPAELRNLVALAGVWLVFAIAEALLSEAGIMAAVAMGLSFQRGEVPEERRLRQFKEQLTVLGISLLFILLAANLRLEVIAAEGWRGIATVLALMFVVRPAAVYLAMRGSSFSWKEKLFIAWIGPRGIVAASVASLFALSLETAGFADGERLLALTFLTIALTVTLQGLTANPLARLLGLKSTTGHRALVIGAGPLARRAARILEEHGRRVTVIDRNLSLVYAAQREGLEALQGNALEEEVLERAGADEAESLLAATVNPEVNVLTVQLAREAFNITRAYPVVDTPEKGAGPQLVEQVGGRIAFGRPIDIRDWEHALNYEPVETFVWAVPKEWPNVPLGEVQMPLELLPLVRIQGSNVEVAHSGQTWRKGERVVFLSRVPEEEAREALARIALVAQEE